MRRPLALQLLRRDTRGIAIIEFALALPLLILFFVVMVEVGRLWMTKRSFENSVVGVARMAASFPEYEDRVRSYAPLIANGLMRGPGTSGINMTLTSLVLKNGGLTEQFAPQTLLGSTSGIGWAGKVVAGDYMNNQAVIFVSATYAYRPIFATLLGNKTITFSKTYTLMPLFSRAYPLRIGTSPDIYVR